MIGFRKIVVIAFLVFVLGYWVATNLFRSFGPHTRFGAQLSLQDANRLIEEYHLLKGEYPDQEMVNSWIGSIWESRSEISPQMERVEYPLTDLRDCLGRSYLVIWEQPVYVVSEDIPGGRGFYTPGDDGVSLSDGNDADDINSWSSHSKPYYSKKQRWEDRREDAIFGGTCSSVVTVLLIILQCCREDHLAKNDGLLDEIREACMQTSLF